MRPEVSTFPAATAAGGRAFTSEPSGALTDTGANAPPGRRQIGCGQAADDEVAGRARDREWAVEVPGMLRRGAGEVEDDLVAGNGHGRGMARSPSGASSTSCPSKDARPGRRVDRRTDDAFRVVEELVHRRDDAVSPRRSQSSARRLSRERVGGELGAEVARDAPRGCASWRRGRSSSSSSSRVGGITTPSSASVREPAGMLPGSDAADVGVVRALTAKPTSVRRHERHVGEMRPARVRVVEDENVTESPGRGA